MEASCVVSFASQFTSAITLLTNKNSRSAVHYTPAWVLIWVYRSPIFFLVVSVDFFCIGLVLFVWQSGQPHATVVVILIFTCITTCGVPVVSWWIVSEHQSSDNGRKLGELKDMRDDAKRIIARHILEDYLTRLKESDASKPTDTDYSISSIYSALLSCVGRRSHAISDNESISTVEALVRNEKRW